MEYRSTSNPTTPSVRDNRNRHELFHKCTQCAWMKIGRHAFEVIAGSNCGSRKMLCFIWCDTNTNRHRKAPKPDAHVTLPNQHDHRSTPFTIKNAGDSGDTNLPYTPLNSISPYGSPSMFLVVSAMLSFDLPATGRVRPVSSHNKGSLNSSSSPPFKKWRSSQR